jgi:hypothetical protein
MATNNDEPNYEYAPVILLFQMHSHLGLGLRHGQALPEIILHEHQAIAKDDLGLPTQNFLGLGDVRLPLARVIGSVLGHHDGHFWVDQLHSLTSHQHNKIQNCHGF